MAGMLLETSDSIVFLSFRNHTRLLYRAPLRPFILGSCIFVSGSDVVQAQNASATTSSVISRYGDYLEGVYSRSSVSSDSKFPPTPSKTYVNLAVVERGSQIRDIEQVRKNVLHGRVDNLLEGKIEIELTDILKPQDNGSPISLVFVEGPPGIGKSTLAWELCRRVGQEAV